MPDATTLPTAHELIRRIEAQDRPAGAWTYDADPSWSNAGTIVFPERILLRIERDDENPGYLWQVERWDQAQETYEPVTSQSGTAAHPIAMAEIAVAFIDEHDLGEQGPSSVYPLAYELGNRIAAGYPRAHWLHYTNDVFADVFEYPGQRRLAFWDEADFMGSIDGYTWVLEEFSSAENAWRTVSASSDMVSIGQLRRTIADFHDKGEAAYRALAAPPEAPVAGRSIHAPTAHGAADDELARRLAERAAALTADEPTPPTAAPAPSRPGTGR